MERITITIDDDLLETVDGLVRRRGYPSRSEAIRELIRDASNRENLSAGRAPCVATLTYVFDHGTRDLSQRLTERQHDHHNLGISTTHVHFDHDSCLEVAILRGPIDKIREFADMLTVQRGVRHASLHIIPLRAGRVTHSHGPGQPEHEHSAL
jgi:CopG family transcriptional regulator, nickel-responsive regulator